LIIEVCSSAWYSKVVDRDVGSKATYEQGACLKLEIFLPVNDALMRWSAGQLSTKTAGQRSRNTAGEPSSPPLRHSATKTAGKIGTLEFVVSITNVTLITNWFKLSAII